MSKFNVGDIVIGNRKARIYGITTQGWTGRVIDTRTDRFSDRAEIKVVYQETDVFTQRREDFPELDDDEYNVLTSEAYWVYEDRFDLYKPCMDESSLEELDKFLSGFGGN